MSEDRSKASLRLLAKRARRRACERNPLAALTMAAWAPGWMMADADKVVSGYQPIRDEIDPWPLMRRFHAAGARLALPVTPPKADLSAPLTFRSWRPSDALREGAFGLLEPTPKAVEVQPDVILLPLLAFDRHGGRLGYGAGFYDRTLARLRALRPIFALGLGFSDQEMTVPCEPHDQPLDAIVTERGYIPVGRRDACD